MTYFYYAPITFILVSRITNLCFTLFNVSRETYYICKSSGWYIIEKGLFQTLVVFRFIVSIVLYQKLLFESPWDEFVFDIIIYDLTLNWNEYSYLHFFSMFHVKHIYIKESSQTYVVFLIHYKYSVISKIIVWVSLRRI